MPNLLPPLELDVTVDWPRDRYDAVFSANTAHIVSLDHLAAMMRGIPGVLRPGGFFALYGPFNYGGRVTSERNARFDRWLKERDPESGINERTGAVFGHPYVFLRAQPGDMDIGLLRDGLSRRRIHLVTP